MGKATGNLARVTRIGLDLAKTVFQVHGVDAKGEVVIARKLRRGTMLEFFGRLGPCMVAMEACGSAQHWGRQLVALGHGVKLIPPAHVKPYGATRRMRPTLRRSARRRCAPVSGSSLCVRLTTRRR